jgi:hypothetical protein
VLQDAGRGVTDKRDPGKGSGGFGTASTFGSLDGWSFAEANDYLSGHSELKRLFISEGNYRRYQFNDGSELIIRPTGEIIRLPRRMYNADGSRIFGKRLNIATGEIIWSSEWHTIPRDEQERVVVDDITNGSDD